MVIAPPSTAELGEAALGLQVISALLFPVVRQAVALRKRKTRKNKKIHFVLTTQASVFKIPKKESLPTLPFIFPPFEALARPPLLRR
jgi:hypothetical protein